MKKMENKFEEDAKKIFKKAGVSLDTQKAKELFEDAKIILQEKMALLASYEGLTWNRVKKYDDQKSMLVDDLEQFMIEHPDELKRR